MPKSGTPKHRLPKHHSTRASPPTEPAGRQRSTRILRARVRMPPRPARPGAAPTRAGAVPCPGRSTPRVPRRRPVARKDPEETPPPQPSPPRPTSGPAAGGQKLPRPVAPPPARPSRPGAPVYSPGSARPGGAGPAGRVCCVGVVARAGSSNRWPGTAPGWRPRPTGP